MDDGEEMCRLCMSEEDTVFYNMYDDSREDSIVCKIYNCLNLKVYLGDGLPSLVCHHCATMLDKLNAFKKMCHTSNEHLSKNYRSGSADQSTLHEEMEVDSLQAVASPGQSGIGCIVEGSERTVDIDPEYIEKRVDDETYEADNDTLSTSSRLSLVELSSDESSEESQRILSSSGSVILQQYSYPLPQSEVSRQNTSLLGTSRSSEPEQALSISELHTSFSPFRVFQTHSGIVLFVNEPLSEVKAINSSETLSSSVVSSAQSTKDKDRNITASDADKSVSQSNNVRKPGFCELVSQNKNEIDEPYTAKRLKIEGKYMKVAPSIINKLTHDSESISHHINGKQTKIVSSDVPFPGISFNVSMPENGEHRKDGKHISYAHHQKHSDVIRLIPGKMVDISSKHEGQGYLGICTSGSSELEADGDQPSIETSLIEIKQHPDVHKCTKCSETFTNNGLLQRHMRKQCATITCDHCPETFISNKSFEIHMRVHSEQKQPFKCGMCDKKFCYRWQRARHETLHSDNDEFKCHLCHKKFTSEVYFVKHQKCHNKTYICEICKKSFSFRFRLNKHMLKSHSPKSENSCSVLKEVGKKDDIYTDVCESSGEIARLGQDSNIQNSSSNKNGTASSNKYIGKSEIKMPRCCGNKNNHPSVSKIERTAKLYDYEQENAQQQTILSEYKENIKHRNSGNTLRISEPSSSSTDVDGRSPKLFKALNLTRKKITSNESKKNGELKLITTDEVTGNEDTPRVVNSETGTPKNVYTCADHDCLQIFHDIDELMNHEQAVHEIRKIYSCTICLKMFTCTEYVSDHSKTCVNK